VNKIHFENKRRELLNTYVLYIWLIIYTHLTIISSHPQNASFSSLSLVPYSHADGLLLWIRDPREREEYDVI